LLIQLLHDDEESAVPREGFIGNTEPAKEEPLIGGKTEPFHLEGLAILGMIALHQTTDEVTDNGMDLFGNETGAALVDRGCSCRINAWASLFMNNSCPVLLKRMMPVAACCGKFCDCFRQLSGRAMSPAVIIGISPPNL
jgi:hypothetical protein